MTDPSLERRSPARRGLPFVAALLAATSFACSSQRSAMRPQPGAEVGEASYYHPSFEGRRTASGEPYRGDRLTCAHRTLAFGTRVRVTRLDGRASVAVVVNDRGPFVRGRVVDLSMAAARRLRLVEEGHARVRVEVIEPAGARSSGDR